MKQSRFAPKKLQKPVTYNKPSKWRWLFVIGNLLALYAFIVVVAVSSIVGAFHSLQATKLDLYQKSYSAVVVNYYASAMNSVLAIANSATIKNDITRNNYSDLTSSLSYQRLYNDQFDTISVFNKDGRVIALSSNATNLNPNITLDLVGSPIKPAVLTHQPQITDAFTTIAKRRAISFTAPITDNKGNYLASVVTASTLKQLPERAPFLNTFQNLHSVIVDNAGTVIVLNSHQVSSLQNISNREPILKALAHKDSVLLSETNFAGQKVVAEATRIHIGTIATTTIISYMPADDYNGLNQGPGKKIILLLAMQVVVNFVLVAVLSTGRKLRWWRR